MKKATLLTAILFASLTPLQGRTWIKYKTTNAVPEYALLSADGERLGSGSQVFSKVAELTAE